MSCLFGVIEFDNLDHRCAISYDTQGYWIDWDYEQTSFPINIIAEETIE